jgi:hypothetical protein
MRANWRQRRARKSWVRVQEMEERSGERSSSGREWRSTNCEGKAHRTRKRGQKRTRRDGMVWINTLKRELPSAR